jgi:hypothetical protein
MTAPTDPAAVYAERRARAADDEGIQDRWSWRLSLARLTAGIVGTGGGLWLLARWGAPPAAAIALALGGFGLLAVLAAIHRRVLAAQAHAAGRRRLAEHGLARLGRDFDALPDPEPPAELVSLPLARDLDLFGRASLFRLVGTVRTPPGRETLARWLVAPAGPAEVTARQSAVRALAPRLDLREELALRAGDLSSGAPFPDRFLAWAAGPRWLASRRGLRWSVGLLTALVPLLGGAAAVTDLPWRLWLLLLVANLAFALLLARRIHPIFDQVSAREGELLVYSRALALLATTTLDEPRLEALRARLLASGADPARELERLHRLGELADLRRSSIYPVVAALTLWDVHVELAMERWQRRCGGHVREWLASLGEWEALAALAALAHDEPGWTFPRVDPEATAFVSAALAHPLIPRDRRVANDVTVGPPATVLLVTGSNMSGKSTLLRAIGLNAVLAQAGGPVAATSLCLPPVVLGTSILVEDSLADGVSFFMAELGRLRQVVGLAAAGDRRLLYLLDEVLRGTNSVERRIAVQRVLDRLLASGAIGAVSTHDLALAETPELRPHLVPVHFRETMRGGEAGTPAMSFDYRLRPGLATTTNALELLRLVGL